MNNCECKPALKRDGTLPSKIHATRLARKALTERIGPPPHPKMLCRHLCENDSSIPNGFICTVHTVWGTYSENAFDIPKETRKRIAKAGGKVGGKIAGKIAVESGHLRRIGSLGGKIGGKISANRPDHATKARVECPHCGKVGQKFAMGRWHFDNCKSKPSA